MSYSQADHAGPRSTFSRRTPEVEILDRIGIPGRMLLLVLALALIYGAVRALTHLLFAPDLSVLELVVPGEPVAAGDRVTVGALVRNQGDLNGAGFVVAVLPGGIEVEGPMLEVEAGGTAMLPVEILANSGGDPVALVAYDGWRGVRRLRTWRSIPLRVAPRTFDAARSAPTGPVERGRVAMYRIPWSNPGPVGEEVRAVAVVRPETGGPPVSSESPQGWFGVGDEGELEVGVDSWNLSPGRHQVLFHVVSDAGRLAGQGAGPLVLEVREP
jgi:hypothetical protein